MNYNHYATLNAVVLQQLCQWCKIITKVFVVRHTFEQCPEPLCLPSGLTQYENVKEIIQTFRVTLEERKLGLLEKMLTCQHIVDRISRGLECAKISTFGFKG